MNYDAYYSYTRIITYHGISFGTGLNIIFQKTDRFIKNYIQKYKKNFNANREFMRFIELYNRYSHDAHRVKPVSHI